MIGKRIVKDRFREKFALCDADPGRQKFGKLQTRLVSKICIASDVANYVQRRRTSTSVLCFRGRKKSKLLGCGLQNSFNTGMRAKKTGKSFEQYFWS